MHWTFELWRQIVWSIWNLTNFWIVRRWHLVLIKTLISTFKLWFDYESSQPNKLKLHRSQRPEFFSYRLVDKEWTWFKLSYLWQWFPWLHSSAHISDLIINISQIYSLVFICDFKTLLWSLIPFKSEINFLHLALIL